MAKEEAYSANKELKNLFDKDFDIIFLDEKNNNSKVWLKWNKRSKIVEIDAIMFHKNIIFLVDIKKSSEKEKIKKYFRDLDKFNSPSNLKKGKFLVDGGDKKDKDKKLKEIEQILEKILEKKGEYAKLILRKISFISNSKITLTGTIKEFERIDCRVIDKGILHYLSEVKERLGEEYFKREIYGLFNISKFEMRENYEREAGEVNFMGDVAKLEQDLKKEKAKIYWAKVPYKLIKEFVTVIRLCQEYDAEGFQRMIEKGRITNISNEFLNKEGTFPNNIIIAFNPTDYKSKSFLKKTNKNLQFKDEYNSLILIDGQHRFFAHGLKKEHENKYLFVGFIYFKEKNPEKIYKRMSRLFLEINDKQKRITGVVRLLLRAKLEPKGPEAFWVNLFKKLNSQRSSPFFKQISFVEPTLKDEEEKKKKSVVSLIIYGGLIPMLEKDIIKRKKIIGKGLRSISSKKNLEKTCKNLFNFYFRMLKSLNFKLEELKITHLAGLFRLMNHFINYDKTRGIMKKIGEQGAASEKEEKDIKKMLSKIPLSKLSKKEYSSSNWGAIEGFYVKSIKKPDYLKFGKKELLSPKGLEELNKK